MAGPRPIALTMGDPAGIGPEIAAHAMAALEGRIKVRYVASRAAMAAAIPGRPETTDPQAVIDSISRAVELVRSGECAAVVTCPIAKKTLTDAGFAFPGHTEYLAHLTGASHPVMMLAVEGLRYGDRRAAGTPRGWVEVHIAAAYAGIRGELARLDKSFAELIAERHGVAIARIEQEISAVALPREVALRLRARAGAPALQILRRYRAADGSVFEYARSVFPAGRYLHRSVIMPAFGG